MAEDVRNEEVAALDAVRSVRLDEPLRSCVLDGRVVVAPEGLGDANLSRSRAVAVLADGAPVDPDGGSACTSAHRGSR